MATNTVRMLSFGIARPLLSAGCPRHARDCRQYPGPVMRLAAMTARMPAEVVVSWPG